MKTNLKISELALLFAAGIIAQCIQNSNASTKPEPLRPSSPDQFHHDTYPVSSRPLVRPKNPTPPPSGTIPFSLEDTIIEATVLRNQNDKLLQSPRPTPKPKSPGPSAASVSPPPSANESASTPNSKKKRKKKSQTPVKIFDEMSYAPYYQQSQDYDDVSPTRSPGSDQYYEEGDELDYIDRSILSKVDQFNRRQQKKDKQKARQANETLAPEKSYASPPPSSTPKSSSTSSPTKTSTPPSSSIDSPVKLEKSYASPPHSSTPKSSSTSSPKKTPTHQPSSIDSPAKKDTTPPRSEPGIPDATGISNETFYGPLPSKDPE